MNKYVSFYIFSFFICVFSDNLYAQKSEAILTQSNFIETIEGLNFEMVFVKGDTFTMGCKPSFAVFCVDDEQPAHQVEVGDFFMATHEVTQKLWQIVMGYNNSVKGACENCPVESVSWNEVQEFLFKISELTGKKYRLPTEAEWEYAARGGTYRRSLLGEEDFRFSGSDTIDDVAWYCKNSNNKPHLVGKKKPNQLGLYDMSGNILEWCADIYDYYLGYMPSEDYENEELPKNLRVLKGGCWGNCFPGCRIVVRYKMKPDMKDDLTGFRIVCETEYLIR